jgi:hypothetical protein
VQEVNRISKSRRAKRARTVILHKKGCEVFYLKQAETLLFGASL